MRRETSLLRKENGIIFTPQISTSPETGIWANINHCTARNLTFFSGSYPNSVRFMFNGGIKIDRQETIIAKLPDFWKASVIIHDGENEYRDLIFIRGAANEIQAMAEARYQASHWWDVEDDKERNPVMPPDVWEEQHGYRTIELDYVSKIDTLEMLLETLSVIDFKEEHVQR